MKEPTRRVEGVRTGKHENCFSVGTKRNVRTCWRFGSRPRFGSRRHERTSYAKVGLRIILFLLFLRIPDQSVRTCSNAEV